MPGARAGKAADVISGGSQWTDPLKVPWVVEGAVSIGSSEEGYVAASIDLTASLRSNRPSLNPSTAWRSGSLPRLMADTGMVSRWLASSPKARPSLESKESGAGRNPGMVTVQGNLDRKSTRLNSSHLGIS